MSKLKAIELSEDEVSILLNALVNSDNHKAGALYRKLLTQLPPHGSIEYPFDGDEFSSFVVLVKRA